MTTTVKKGTGRPAAAAKRAKAAQKSAAPAKSNGKAPKVRAYRPITEGLSGDGASKAATVGELLREAGWKVMRQSGQPRVDASRGSERLTLVWTEKGAHSAELSAYRATEDGKPRRVQNVATALRIARRAS